MRAVVAFVCLGVLACGPASVVEGPGVDGSPAGASTLGTAPRPVAADAPRIRLLRARAAGNISSYVEFVLETSADAAVPWEIEVAVPPACTCSAGRLHFRGQVGTRLAGRATSGAAVRLFYYPGDGPPGSSALVTLRAGATAERQVAVPNF